MRVLVVEDGDIGRLGRTAALEAAGHEVVSCTWQDLAGFAAVEGAAPDQLDVVVPVLTPDPTSWDRFPVMATMAAFRQSLGPRTATVGVVESAGFHNPVLRLRVERAGIERVVDASTVRTVDDMHSVATDSSAATPTRPSDVELLSAGVTRGSDPDAVVAWVLDRLSGPLAESYRRAFDPRITQAACGLSRRQAHTLRVRVAGLGRIRPSQSCSGGGPVRDRSLPRWNEVVAVVNLCRGLEYGSIGAVEGGAGGQVESWRAA